MTESPMNVMFFDGIVGVVLSEPFPDLSFALSLDFSGLGFLSLAPSSWEPLPSAGLSLLELSLPGLASVSSPSPAA